jgi:phage tail-like protein
MADFPELLLSSRFYLELTLDGGTEADATFLECKGLKRNQEVADFCEVAPQKWAQAKLGQVVRTKMPGNVKTENLVLRRGMTNSMTLWKWFADVEAGNWAKQLKEGSLVIYAQGGEEQARFNFQDAFPVRYSAADVSAQSNEMEIEELEMAIASFTRTK